MHGRFRDAHGCRGAHRLGPHGMKAWHIQSWGFNWEINSSNSRLHWISEGSRPSPIRSVREIALSASRSRNSSSLMPPASGLSAGWERSPSSPRLTFLTRIWPISRAGLNPTFGKLARLGVADRSERTALAAASAISKRSGTPLMRAIAIIAKDVLPDAMD